MNENSLTIFTKASQMLVEANTIQKTKELKDLALTAADWARRKGMGEEAIRYARSYALEAEKKMGQMLRETERADGGDAQRTRLQGVTESPPTLADLGITKRESSNAQFLAKLPDEIFEKVKAGESTVHKVYTDIKKSEQIKTGQKAIAAEYEHNVEKPIIINSDSTPIITKCDLLITDPPYMTDIDNINDFAKWLPGKLKCVKDTGFAFIFIGAYPEELNAYLNTAMPAQVLVWTYRNTLGAAPKDRYKLNWQAILFYRMPNSPPLDCPLTNELWAVQDINAPDGRHEGRYHAWEKPLELAERLIRHTTKAGDIILDPFAGTGTFLLAGSKLGRKATGYETDKAMIDIAIRRGCKVG